MRRRQPHGPGVVALRAGARGAARLRAPIDRAAARSSQGRSWWASRTSSGFRSGRSSQDEDALALRAGDRPLGHARREGLFPVTNELARLRVRERPLRSHLAHHGWSDAGRRRRDADLRASVEERQRLVRQDISPHLHAHAAFLREQREALSRRPVLTWPSSGFGPRLIEAGSGPFASSVSPASTSGSTLPF